MTMIGSTVLVVDDDPIIVQALCRRLTRAGYVVIGCTDAESALAEVRARPELALVITDLHIGQTSGLDLVREVRELRPTTRTIMLTGDDIDLIGDLPGMVLQKPVRGSVLLRVIAS